MSLGLDLALWGVLLGGMRWGHGATSQAPSVWQGHGWALQATLWWPCLVSAAWGQGAHLETPEDVGLRDARSRECAGVAQQEAGAGGRAPRGWADVNSQARLWVLGAQARPWLLSGQDFLGLRCCLDSPVGRR